MGTIVQGREAKGRKKTPKKEKKEKKGGPCREGDNLNKNHMKRIAPLRNWWRKTGRVLEA